MPVLRAGVAQLVERVLAKHKVDGSKPFTRSTEFLIDSTAFRMSRVGNRLKSFLV
jgi:hypothetical protein